MTKPHLLLRAVGLAVAIFSLATGTRAATGLSPAEAQVQLKAGTAVLIDIREPAEWTSGVAAPAVLLPMSDFNGPRKQWAGFLEQNRGKTLILYCASGRRAGLTATKLEAEGFTVQNLGGFSAWKAAGLPVRKP